MAGWGQYLQEFLGPGYQVKNYARDAVTLRGYRRAPQPVNAEGRWMWRRVVAWPAGEHVLRAVGLDERGVSPAAAVGFTVRDHVEAPAVLGPREGAWSGPRPRFSGTAAQGVSKVMVLEGGRLIAETRVKEDGTWSVKHPHDREPACTGSSSSRSSARSARARPCSPSRSTGFPTAVG